LPLLDRVQSFHKGLVLLLQLCLQACTLGIQVALDLRRRQIITMMLFNKDSKPRVLLLLQLSGYGL
jgi:hypothetical protein